MNIIQFNFKQIKSRPLSSVLNIILFATGVTIISLVFLLKDSFENQMDKNAGGIDLVVGAKGSPLQLILSGIYHVDYPTGNIDYNEAIELSKNPLIKQAIPLALGDNFNGFRIVGTNKAYPTIYNGQIQAGSLWLKDFEVTIGSKVASKTGLTIGRQFAGVHGLSAESDDVHESTPYTVTGIFKETGTVLDQLILTNIESYGKYMIAMSIITSIARQNRIMSIIQMEDMIMSTMQIVITAMRSMNTKMGSILKK